MNIQAHQAEYRDVEAMRELYRQELNCQFFTAILPSIGLADAPLIILGFS